MFLLIVSPLPPPICLVFVELSHIYPVLLRKASAIFACLFAY